MKTTQHLSVTGDWENSLKVLKHTANSLSLKYSVNHWERNSFMAFCTVATTAGFRPEAPEPARAVVRLTTPFAIRISNTRARSIAWVGVGNKLAGKGAEYAVDPCSASGTGESSNEETADEGASVVPSRTAKMVEPLASSSTKQLLVSVTEASSSIKRVRLYDPVAPPVTASGNVVGSSTPRTVN